MFALKYIRSGLQRIHYVERLLPHNSILNEADMQVRISSLVSQAIHGSIFTRQRIGHTVFVAKQFAELKFYAQ